MSQYIGKTISLISNKGLRYVGLLENINADDATVALKSVRLFGTEGRMAAMGQPHLEVSPGVDVYDYVVFRGSDVKDLSVLDTPIDEVKPNIYRPPQQQQQQPTPTTGQYYSGPPSTTTANGAPQTQAPVTTTTATSAQSPVQSSVSQTTNVPAASPGQVAQAPVETGIPEAPQVQNPAPTRTIDEEPLTKTVSENKPADAQPGSVPQPAATQKPRRESKLDIPPEEFDFEQANAKFSKELEQERELEHTGYNKSSSFFDNISSSTEERTNMRWSEERNLNMDTFGEASLQRGGRGGRGGRGRGGRGNCRGRGGNYRGRGNGNWRGGNNNRGRNSDYNTKPEWA